MASVTWLDLSSIGVHLGSYKDANKETGLALVDMNGKYRDQILGLGFQAAPGAFADGVYVKPSGKITPGALRNAFGETAVKAVVGDVAVINRAFNQMVRQRTKMNSNAFFAQQRQLGLNHLGEVVQESVIGRFIVRFDAHGRSRVVREDGSDPAAFLRATDRDSLRKVVDGFVSRITIRGDKLRKENVDALMTLSNAADFSVRDYQEAIEAGLNRLLQKELDKVETRGLGAFDVANKIYVGMPELRQRTASSVANQQYSTPVAMAVLMQALLPVPEELENVSFFDPTIGNGNLVSMFRGAQIYGAEIDQARIAQLGDMVTQVVHGDATILDFRSEFGKPDGFDFVIANPPFGSLESKMEIDLPAGSAVKSLTTARQDHCILLRALHARADSGHAVFLTGADSALGDGEIKGRSKALLNYLHDHYEMQGVVDISGELFKKQGATYPLRLYVVGARRPAPVQSAVPETLPVIRTYEGLRDWAAAIIQSDKPVVLEADTLQEERKKTITTESDSVATAIFGRKNPWEMRRQEWMDAVSQLRDISVQANWTRASGGQEAARIAELARLRFDVTAEASQQIKAAQAGELKLSPEELEAITERLQTPVDHRDVIEKALREGLSVPDAVLGDYPELAERVSAMTKKAEDVRQDNEYQQRYIAYSNVGEPKTMIPANLSGPVYEALTNIQAEYGDIDEFVAKELDFAVGDLGKYFEPEQVDALAMIFSAHDRDLGFLLADRMGVGKGRVLAAVARREKLQGRIPVFVTVTPNLFTDFLERDIEAIGSRHLFKNPLIINDGVKTLDSNGDVVAKSLKREEYRRYAEAGELPPETDLVMLTYSQICRRPESHLTSRYLGWVCERYPVALLLDESHNGAGASNTSDNLAYMISAMGSRGRVVYSSGTPIKGASNLNLYRKVLPEGVNPDELLAAVKSDPLSLQEALIYEIAAQGCLISRELDDAGIEKEFVVSENVERNRQIANQMAEILTAMSFMSGDVSRLVTGLNKDFVKDLEKLDEKDREGSRMMASSMNFGSRLYQINRQFLLALKARDIVDYVRQAINENKKPIIALQHTGESLLTDFVTRANEVYDNDSSRVEKTIGVTHLTTPVSFKDLMRRYVERIMWIKVQGRYGDVSYREAGSAAETDEQAEAMKKSVERLLKLIDALPDDLPLTPIDYVRDQLDKDGITVAEISGRNLQMRYLADGTASIEPVQGRGDKTRVNRAVRDFNNGEVDVLFLTASGSTGLSVQASPAVGRDTRIRQMIKWEMQSDITRERQMDYRHNRTGQIERPEYKIPLSGLPADDRIAMMFNNKNRSLTASTVANRDSKDLIRQVPDLLNVVGDESAERLLMENPELAKHLDIDMPQDADERMAKGPLWYCNKLSGRISLLPVEQQEAVYTEWQSRFNELLDRLKAEGRNPLEVECYDWRAEVIDRSVFLGEAAAATERTRSQLSLPVFLTTLEYKQTVKAVRAEEIDKMIGRNVEALSAIGGAAIVGREFNTIAEYLKANRGSILTKHLGRRFSSVGDALHDKNPNEVKATNEKIDWLLNNLPRLGYGSIYLDKDLDGQLVPHVVLRVNQPSNSDGYTRLSDYVLFSMKPGSDVVQMHTLSGLFSKGESIEPVRFKDSSFVRAEFDNAKNGVIRKKARVLDGNMFEAVSLNLRERVGSKIVYTDASGARQHGILVYSNISDRKLAAIPERVRDPALLADLVKHIPFGTNPRGEVGGKEARNDVVFMRTGNGNIELRAPGSKMWGGDIFLDPVLSVIAGKEKENKFNLIFSLSNGKMVATVPEYQLCDVIRYLSEEKELKFYVRDKETLKKVRELRKNANCDPTPELA